MNGSAIDPTAAIVREAGFSDCAQAEALLASFGLGVGDGPEDAQRWWEWIWQRNPALATDRPQPPLGWTLEDAGEVVGFFGNIPARYRFGDATLLVAVASHWAVKKPYRSRTRELANAYFGQERVDLLMVTTGIAATGRLFDAPAMPQRHYQQVLYWVIDSAGFLSAALRKQKLQPGLARFGGRALAPALAGAVGLRRSRPGRLRAGVEPEALSPNAVGDEFDDLWRRKLAEGRRLYAYRTAEDIRWHFERSRAESIHLLCCRRAGRLDGYAVLAREAVAEIGLERLSVVDFFVAGNDPGVIDALLAAAYELGRERGAHVLELVGFPSEIRARAERFRPFSRLYPTFPFHYKAGAAELQQALAEEEAWYPCLYDGDGCLG